MTDTSTTAFLGDRERTFALSAKLIVELERLTGTGVGSLAKNLFAGQFRHQDVIETIRLGLIGGGSSPEDAKALVDVYIIDRPLAEGFSLAVQILEAVWF